MTRALATTNLLASIALGTSATAWAGQASGAASDPDVPVSHRDRVYAAEQFSNTVSVTDPADDGLLGVVRLGDPQPGNLSPLYHGQLLVLLDPARRCCRCWTRRAMAMENIHRPEARRRLRSKRDREA